MLAKKGQRQVGRVTSGERGENLTPHTTHQMQPLDKTVYGPLKRNYNEECDRWMLKNLAQ